MSEELAKDTGSGFQRVYMTPDDNPEGKHTADDAIKEGRVKTEAEHFQEQHNVSLEEKPVEEESGELFAGKYKTPDELEKAYLELQTKLGGETDKEPTKEEAKAGESDEVNVDNIDDALFSKSYSEWEETGTLSENTIKEFVDKGIPEQYVKQYVEGANAQIKLVTMQIYDKLGGEQHVIELTDWAEKNLSEKEVDTYNDLIDSGDIDKILTAYQSIEARMEGGTQRKFIKPTDGAGNQSAGFESRAQMVEAINDPKYSKDPAYRAEVERKLQRTKNL